MSEPTDTYWAVTARVYAMDTWEEAERFMNTMIDAFSAMPESEGYGASWEVVPVTDNMKGGE